MDLKQSYQELYGKGKVSEQRFHELLEIMEKAKAERPAWLREQDAEGNSWYLSEKMAGIMLYTDHFCGDLYGMEE